MLKKGDLVKLNKTTRYIDAETNPIWGGSCGFITGRILNRSYGEYKVLWSNGKKNGAYIEGRDLSLADKRIVLRDFISKL